MIAALQIIIKEVVEVLIFDRTTRFAAVYIARLAAAADLFGFEAALSASAAYTLSFILMP